MSIALALVGVGVILYTVLLVSGGTSKKASTNEPSRRFDESSDTLDPSVDEQATDTDRPISGEDDATSTSIDGPEGDSGWKSITSRQRQFVVAAPHDLMLMDDSPGATTPDYRYLALYPKLGTVVNVERIPRPGFNSDLSQEDALTAVEEGNEDAGHPLTPIPELDPRGRVARGYTATVKGSTNSLIMIASPDWMTQITIFEALEDNKQVGVSFELMQWVLDHFEDRSEAAAASSTSAAIS